MTFPVGPRVARDATQSILAGIAPNAARLKEAYASNLGRALLVAVNIHLLAVGAYWVAAVALHADQAEAAPVPPHEWIPVTPNFPPTPPDLTPTPQPPGGGTPTQGNPSGAIALVEDTRADPDATVATQDEMQVSQIGPVGDRASAGDGTTEGPGSVAPQRPDPPVDDLTPPGLPPAREDAAEEAPAPDEIRTFTEVAPEIVGGLEGVQARVTYPRFDRDAGNQGTVVVRFVVEPTGVPSTVEVARSVSPGLDAAAVEAVRQTRFTPGVQNGQPVRVRMTLPVRFTIR